ncbi:FecR family protein [Flagellimonas flava]|uniref:FecR family protein n=1 Tax=Flagellimonas flava TaxID=570519 RepID=A0A1M5NMA2_9FLAO|nr:FecR domain-containing protein [Allomuricauda flava]SHG90339.1 FecR family protein [Allomuricauda flava]
MKYCKYEVEDFVMDEYFQKWILDSDSLTSNFWENWISDHPEKKEIVEKAKRQILLMNFDNDPLSKQDFDTMWRVIVERRKDDHKDPRQFHFFEKYRKLALLRAAAVFIGFTVACFGIYQSGLFDTNSVPSLSGSEITLELEDGTVKVLKENSTNIVKDSEGSIIVRQEENTLLYESPESRKETLHYNQLTVPYGKKFELMLSDGTHVFLNSGSKLRYPVTFLKDSNRDVYLDGEAYFSVKRDEERPFTVITDDMNTRVYGTEFNVSSYKNENNTSTVLVEGSVGVYRSNNDEALKPIAIAPGQRAVYQDNTIAVEDAEVLKYIAWKENKLLFANDSFDLILKELERHFNVRINNRFLALNNKRFTGTFEHESLDIILKVFSEHTAFDFTVEGETIIITERK